MKSGFLYRLLDRAEKIDKERIVDYLKDIANERDLLVHLFDSIHEGMIVIDVEEKVVYINKSARDILGLGDGINTPELQLVRLLHHQPLLDLCREGMETEETIHSREFTLRRHDRLQFLLVSMIPLRIKGQRFGTLYLFEDETEHKERDQKLREAEKLAALTTLSAGMSHEIRNPLNSLSIHLQLLQRHIKKKGIQDQEAEEVLTIFSNEIKRLNDVIDRFLSAIKPSQPQLRLVSLYTLVTETLRLMEPEFLENHISVSLHEEGEWPYIEADETQLKQALINLLRNAIEAIDSQYEEEFNGKESEVFLRMVCKDGTVTLVFADTGKGIEPEDLPHIFEPYFTTKSRGTGLGLMIVDRIIREHNGSISVHSEPGQGTQFIVTFPVAAETVRLLEHGKTKLRIHNEIHTPSQNFNDFDVK
ncbi:MAG: PAS domain S-box protein [Candidatus Omnitrophota bacterium]|jgi:PAS domain S-box-containing protein|nr:MAG: PAS domain S-box protein [Candidatus Omnitrophota bacterium]